MPGRARLGQGLAQSALKVVGFSELDSALDSIFRIKIKAPVSRGFAGQAPS